MEKRSVMVFILSFIVLAGAGIVYLFIPKGVNAPFLLPQPAPITPTPTGWKTYENKEFGFAFEYPGDWTITERSSKLNWGSKEQNRNILIDAYYIDFHDPKNKTSIGNQGDFIFGVEITKYPTDEVKRKMLGYTPENTIILGGKIKGGLTESLIGPEADFFIDHTSLAFATPDRSNLLKDIIKTFRFLK